MNQIEITESLELLNKNGIIDNPGWSRRPPWQYDRSRIKAGALRIKEWDYYYVLSDNLKKGITFTISDLGYAGLMAVCWLDFERKEFIQADTIAPLTLGKVTADADNISYKDKTMSIAFRVEGNRRILNFAVPDVKIPGGGTGLSGEISLDQPESLESMNIATSWKENRKRFYYNQKINCMAASGTVLAGGKEVQFDPAGDFGGLDWGRGAWTYTNQWYWGSGSGLIGGEHFGFNLGYGFSDRTPATENMLFYKGVAHKLEEVSFIYGSSDFTKPWKFTSSDGRFEMDFTPLIDRESHVNLLAIRSDQHQVFGYFNGKAVLDDGTVLELQDFLGFAEDVYNRW